MLSFLREVRTLQIGRQLLNFFLNLLGFVALHGGAAHTEHDTKSHAGNEDGSTTLGDERERLTGHRHHTHIDADVEKRLEDDKHRHTHNEERGESALATPCDASGTSKEPQTLKDKKINFRRYRKWYLFKVPRVDTGSANWYPLYSKYDMQKVNRVRFAGWNIVDNKPTTIEEAQGSFIQEKLVDYSVDKTWVHTICGAEWRDVKGKNQIIYKILDDILFDRY